MEHFKLWSKLQPFDENSLLRVPEKEGIYIIHHNNKPYYIGCSATLGSRLRTHLRKRGSRKVKEGIEAGWQFTFTYAEILSYQQAEAIFQDAIGEVALGNMRRETDPADRWKN